MSVKIMDDKKSDEQVKAFSTKGLFAFIAEVKQEFKKISWTDKDELKVYTKVVVAFTFVFGMSVLFTDVVIQQALAGLNGFIRLITG